MQNLGVRCTQMRRTPLKATPGSMWSLAFVLLFLATVPARAQFRTSIQGTVTDPTGAVIPGATLTLTDLGTNETRTTTSDEVGVFNFNALPADHFNLTVVRDGFQKKVLNDLQLIPEQANAVNVQLEIGVSTQTVTVDASTVSALDTETANNGQTITENEIQHMPVFERDATSLIQLAPGTLPTDRTRAAAADSKLPERRPEPRRAAAAIWATPAAFLPRKTALGQHQRQPV